MNVVGGRNHSVQHSEVTAMGLPMLSPTLVPYSTLRVPLVLLGHDVSTTHSTAWGSALILGV